MKAAAIRCYSLLFAAIGRESEHGCFLEPRVTAAASEHEAFIWFSADAP